MSDLPSLTGGEVIRALERAGFVVARQRGSHVRLTHSDGRRTVVPVHQGDDIDRQLLRAIIRQCGLTVDDFLDRLR